MSSRASSARYTATRRSFGRRAKQSPYRPPVRTSAALEITKPHEKPLIKFRTSWMVQSAEKMRVAQRASSSPSIATATVPASTTSPPSLMSVDPFQLAADNAAHLNSSQESLLPPPVSEAHLQSRTMPMSTTAPTSTTNTGPSGSTLHYGGLR